MKSSSHSWDISFLFSFYRHRRSPGAPGNHEDGGKKKKKVYKIFKSKETSPIARGNKFPLTFYFRFVRNAREPSGVRTNDGGGGKKLQKEKGRRKVTEMPEGHIEKRLDDGRQLLCAWEKLYLDKYCSIPSSFLIIRISACSKM